MRRHFILFDIQREEWSYHNLKEEHTIEVRGNFSKNQNIHNTYKTRCVKLYKIKELLVFASWNKQIKYELLCLHHKKINNAILSWNWSNSEINRKHISMIRKKNDTFTVCHISSQLSFNSLQVVYVKRAICAFLANVPK